jgi:ketosteroid isomerase-like protein
MPNDHVALTLRFAEALSSGEAERVIACVDPEVRFEPARTATEGAFIGHEGMRRFVEDTLESFDLFEVRASETFEFEDGAVAIGTVHVKGKGSGIETEVPGAVVCWFRDGLVTHAKDYGERQAALEAAGLA